MLLMFGGHSFGHESLLSLIFSPSYQFLAVPYQMLIHAEFTPLYPLIRPVSLNRRKRVEAADARTI